MTTYRPKNMSELDEPLIASGELFHHLSGSNVVWIDENKLMEDFGHFDRSSDNIKSIKTHNPVQKLIIDNCAIISNSQLTNNIVNEKINITDRTVMAFRPPRYGRAAVVEVREKGNLLGLLDVKGIGVRAGEVPSGLFHGTGLLPLVEAFREVTWQKIIEKVFNCLGISVAGVPLYAVIDLGFNITHESTPGPAGAIVRMAHQRPPGNNELCAKNSDDQKTKLKIELILRHFGITSANPRGRFRVRQNPTTGSMECTLNFKTKRNVCERDIKKILAKSVCASNAEFDVLNVQIVRGASLLPLSATIVDFGHYHAMSDGFEKPLLSVTKGKHFCWDRVIYPDSKLWVSPNLSVAKSFRILGDQDAPSDVWEAFGMVPPKRSQGMTIFCMSLVRDIRNRKADTGEVQMRIEDFCSAATCSLQNLVSSIE